MVPLSDAPDWVLKAGIDYANDELDDNSEVSVSERNGKIVVKWECKELDSPTVESDKRGTRELGGGGVESKEAVGTKKSFRQELE